MIEIQSLASSSMGNCYHVTDGRTPLLLECGIPFSEIRKKLHFKTSEIAACFISHEHKDHSRAIKDVVRAGIDVYASQGTIDGLGIQSHRIKVIRSKQAFTLGTWRVLPFDTQHNANEPLGFLFANKSGEKLLFATDTYYVKYTFRGLTHIMVECNYARDILNQNVVSGEVAKPMKKRLIRAHFELENVKKFLLANDLSRVQEIWLLHLSNKNSDADRFKREIQAVTGKVVYIA